MVERRLDHHGSLQHWAGSWGLGGRSRRNVWLGPPGESRREHRALAGTLPPLLNNAVLVGVSLIGTIYLLLVHDLSKSQLIEFGVILLVLGLVAAGGVVALRFPETATRLAVWLAGRWAALRRKPFTPENTISSVRQFVARLGFPAQGQMAAPIARRNRQHRL